MEQTREHLLKGLVAVVQELSVDKLLEMLDFASYLHSKYSSLPPERGSAEAILQAPERTGPLQFELGSWMPC